MSTRLFPVCLVTLALVAAGCGSDGDGGAATTSPSAVSTTAPPSTTTAPTTVPASTTTAPLPSTTTRTTAAPTTTAAPITAADLVLRSDGIGPVVFGAAAADALGTFTALLGPATADNARAYPVDDGGGSFTDDTGEFVFEFHFGRTVCFVNGLCTQFGGDTAESVQFVGWSYGVPEEAISREPALFTAAGVGPDSRWSDHLDVMEVGPGGCYSYGTGTTEGIGLDLLSTGVWFLVVDDAGNATPTLPDPADVTVVLMRAGALEGYLFGDC